MAAITSAVVVAAGAAYSANRQSKAAKEASRAQERAANQSAELTRDAQSQLREDLAPYREIGQTAIPLLQDFSLNPQKSVERLESNPLFQASLSSLDRASLGSAANQGRIGTGDFEGQIRENYLLAASPLLQQEEQRLLNLAKLGQTSAAQTGVSGLDAAGRIGGSLMSGAEAAGAGRVAAAQINAQRNQDILNTVVPLIAQRGGGNG